MGARKNPICCVHGWACWKTYVGRPETHRTWISAMLLLADGLGITSVRHYEEARAVYLAGLAACDDKSM